MNIFSLLSKSQQRSDAPLISLIMPTYNRAWTLSSTIQAIAIQTYTNWELIIVDDGSTDESADLLHDLVQADKRIQLLSQHHTGVSAARQLGLNRANGVWVFYVDSDDELYPDCLRSFVNYTKSHPTVGYGVVNRDQRSERYTDDVVIEQEVQRDPTITNNLTIHDYINWEIEPCGTGIFHKRALVNKKIVWDTRLHLLEDVDFIFQLARRYPHQFGFVSDAVFCQRVIYDRDSAARNASTQAWINAFDYVYNKHSHWVDLGGQHWLNERTKFLRTLRDLESENETKL